MLWVLSGSHKLGLNADLCDSACAHVLVSPGLGVGSGAQEACLPSVPQWLRSLVPSEVTQALPNPVPAGSA